MRSLILFASLMSLGCPNLVDQDPALNLDEYDRSCAFDNDCQLVMDPDPCRGCRCQETAVSKDAVTAYQSNHDAVRAQCDPNPTLISCEESCSTVEIAAACIAGTCGTRAVQTVTADDYDRSCVMDEDCVGVFEGDVCATCKCPNAAIAKTAQADYDLAFTMNACGAPAPCAADCAVVAPTCQGGTCAP